MKTSIRSGLMVLMFLYLVALGPKVLGISPPDGCYPGFTTAEGCNALRSLTSGAGNTGVGWHSLYSDTTGSYNTAVGAGALVRNTGDSNTAVGTVALLLNTTGTQNTAVGTDALVYNDRGNYNTAVGYIALQSNTGGGQNCAFGWGALHSNTDAMDNTAVGVNALGASNAPDNTAVGYHALYNDTAGHDNTALGDDALLNNVDGFDNTAIGEGAGSNITGSGNVCVGQLMFGQAGVNNRTWIRNVYEDVATDRIVYADADGHLGTLSSSRRYKEQIKPMDKASETLLALRPVTFRYKKDVDPRQTRAFGLIAEEVAEVSPDLITRDRDGRPQTVRYDAVNAMLLNEFLKEHRMVEKQTATIAQLKKDLQALNVQQREEIRVLSAQLKDQAAQIQKVSTRLEIERQAPRMAGK